MKEKLLINVALLLLIAGFVGVAVWRVARTPEEWGGAAKAPAEVAQMRVAAEKTLDASAVAAAAENGLLYVATRSSVVVLRGTETVATHSVDAGVRSIAVHGGRVYLVYKTRIEVADTALAPLMTIAACSDNTEFCAVAKVGSSIFASDAENKNLVRYDLDGTFREFITSPRKFVVPSLIFGLAAKGDTLLAVNPGRHAIEFYTAGGKFIRAFEGGFRGCCNPAFIMVEADGSIVASEKGEQRVSRYSATGRLLGVLAGESMLDPHLATPTAAALAPTDSAPVLVLGRRVMWLK